MTKARFRSAEQRIAEKQAEAAAMGVDEAYISTLVDEFYTRVRADEMLGPIFARAITGDWEPHLATMRAFWSSVMLTSGRYKGNPMIKHMRLEGMKPQLFMRWLALFRDAGFEVLDLIELRPPEGAVTTYEEFSTLDWSRRWPSENLWRLRKRSAS